jgi:purine-binding chemotaxis protein CheW
MSQITQYCTFKVGENLFGIPVLEVQEVIRPLAKTEIPLAEERVRGLINLRGQIVTLIGLRELFHFEKGNEENAMNIVVETNDSLFALVVDDVGDVLDVEQKSFEKTPATLDPNLKTFVKGVHKLQDELLVVLDLDKVFNF